MRKWLFYKILETSPVVVEFRRVDGADVHQFLPSKMVGEIVFYGTEPADKMVARFVRNCGWVGEPPRAWDNPISQTVLNGRW